METNRQYLDAQGQPVSVCSEGCGASRVVEDWIDGKPLFVVAVTWSRNVECDLDEHAHCYNCGTLCGIAEDGRPYVEEMVNPAALAQAMLECNKLAGKRVALWPGQCWKAGLWICCIVGGAWAEDHNPLQAVLKLTAALVAAEEGDE